MILVEEVYFWQLREVKLQKESIFRDIMEGASS